MVAAFQALGVAHGLERPGNHLAYGGIIGRHHFLFDRLQLQSVIAVCRASTALPDTGCKLFDQVRQQRSVVNDADRPRKFLHKFGLNWELLKQSY